MTAFIDPDRGDAGDLFDDLASQDGAPDAPDMTRSIMARLGYMRVSEAVARRRRRRGRLVRLATVAAGLVLLGAGMRLHEIGPAARRPDGPTVHSALHNDVSRTQQHLDHAIRTFQKLGTRMAPGRGRPASVAPAPAPKPPVTETEQPRPAAPSGGVLPELIDGDAELWDLGPARWL